jgi:hypothetical protein
MSESQITHAEVKFPPTINMSYRRQRYYNLLIQVETMSSRYLTHASSYPILNT